MSGASKTAIFGSGFAARCHLDALSRLGAVVEVCGIASRNLEQATRLGKEYGIERVTSDYRELLESSTLDVVHVCTPNSLALPDGFRRHPCRQTRPLRKTLGHKRGAGGEARRASSRTGCEELHLL